MSGPSDHPLAQFEATVASAVELCDTLELHSIAMEREHRRMCDGLRALREVFAAPGDEHA